MADGARWGDRNRHENSRSVGNDGLMQQAEFPMPVVLESQFSLRFSVHACSAARVRATRLLSASRELRSLNMFSARYVLRHCGEM